MFRLAGLCQDEHVQIRLAGLCQDEHVQISRVVPG